MKPYNQWFYCNMDELIEINRNVKGIKQINMILKTKSIISYICKNK